MHNVLNKAIWPTGHTEKDGISLFSNIYLRKHHHSIGSKKCLTWNVAGSNGRYLIWYKKCTGSGRRGSREGQGSNFLTAFGGNYSNAKYNFN